MTPSAASSRFHQDVQLEHICSYWASLTAPELVGPVPEGIRTNVYVTGGEVSGPKMRGRVRAVGGDWLLVRRDGIGLLDVRATFELEDGAVFYTTYSGIGDLGPDGYERFLAGNPPRRFDLRIAPRYQTAHPDYQWVHRVQCVGVGVADLVASRVEYDVYAVR